MHPSANTAGGRRVTRWTRELIITKILEWNELYGEPPCSADWNPSLARWRAQEWRVERYRAGVWPSTNAAKRPFGGSFDAAVRAAGLEPHRSGPRRRPPGVARPAVAQREPMAPRSVDDALLEASERVHAMERRVAELERALAAAERRADRAEDQLSDARVRARRASERERRARNGRERVRVAERAASEQVEALAADADARVRAAYDQAQAAVADTRETIRLAFIAALQNLPPRQRAVLILCEVLRWKASEVAELLDTSVASVNSALQRARATLEQRDMDADEVAPEVGSADAELLERYVAAFERYDMEALTALLHEDATLSMPPYDLWLQGERDIVAWMLGPGAKCRGSRMVPVAANGSPAWGQYRRREDGAGYDPWALVVIETRDGKVTGINSFLDTDRLFPAFGLPPRLD